MEILLLCLVEREMHVGIPPKEYRSRYARNVDAATRQITLNPKEVAKRRCWNQFIVKKDMQSTEESIYTVVGMWRSKLYL